MATTSIEWTRGEDGSAGMTWNPTTGCDRVSPGCDNCYALTMAKRLKGMGSAKYQRDGDPVTSGPGFGVSMHPDTLTEPFKWRKPRKVFVNSMSDLFHKEINDGFIAAVFGVMAATPQHTYQILTKRHARMRALLSSERFGDLLAAAIRKMYYELGWPVPGDLAYRWPLRNAWLGVSVENQHWADIRIPALLETPAAVRFISAEPLLGPIDLEFIRYVEPDPGCHSALSPCYDPGCGREPGRHWGINWVITGGESGAGARPIDPDWVRAVRDQCQSAGVAFLHKQWGGIRPKSNGRELDGRTWDQYPS